MATFVPLRPTAESEEVLSRLSQEEKDGMTRKCVQACIVLSQNRTPIKKADLNKLVFSTSHFRLHNAVIQNANHDLNKHYGMRLFELSDKARYLLVNTKADFTSYQTFNQEECNEFTVLYFILIELFASPDENISEEDIRNSLSPMKMTNDELKSCLDSLTKHLYLTQTRNQDTRSYAWGPRSMAEVDPDIFFKLFLDMVGDTSDKDWPEQKKRVDKLRAIENR